MTQGMLSDLQSRAWKEDAEKYLGEPPRYAENI